MIAPLENLVEALSRLPTIGTKSAWRLALHILEQPDDEVENLTTCIAALKKDVVVCQECYNYSETAVCPICSSSSRDRSILCVVEKPIDVITLEKTGRYRGVYHVLGGLLSPINGITADKLRFAEMKKRVATLCPDEMIIGLGCSADAETTALYCARLFAQSPMRITRFARGLPAGTELEYVDQMTLGQALHERITVHYTTNHEV